MLHNFHLAALSKTKGQFWLFHIPLHQSLQDELAASWSQQLEQFTSGITEVSFDIGYAPSEHERFRLPDYELSEPLAGINSQNIQNNSRIADNEAAMESIKAIIGFCRTKNSEELVLFQNFTKSDVIKPGQFLFLQGDTYKSAQHPGLALDRKLTAVVRVREQILLFDNFRATNTFLPLADFYKEASEEEITKILEHEALAPEDTKALAVNANQWFRKRFAMLRDSKVLETYSPKEIKARSKGYDVHVTVKGGKIVFPKESSAAKKLLQFLNEELYRGPITEVIYETNSKRKAV